MLWITVNHGWGGPESTGKRTWLASVIVDAFEEQVPLPDAYYVEETLLQVLADEFEMVLEDDSVEGIAKDIVQLWDDSHFGKLDLLESLEKRMEILRGKKMLVQEGRETVDEMDEDEDENEDEDDEGDWKDEPKVPQLLDHQAASSKEPVIDEDGFTLVHRKGKLSK